MRSPRRVSYEETEESSELEEEIYESPQSKKPKSKGPAYHDEVIEFNPNLPPAAFPTLDHPDYEHNGGTIAIDLSEFEGRNSANNAFSLDRGIQPKKIGLTENLPAMTSTARDSTHSHTATQKASMVQKQSQGIMLSSIHGEASDNGPRNPIWVSNMARMEEVGRMSDLDRIMLEMESSDEENATTKRSRFAASPGFPTWDDLTTAHKLNLADTVIEFYPDLPQVMHQLRLSVSQKEELGELLKQRRDREAREEANQQRLQEQTKEVLLQGRRLSQSKFHQMVEENLYGEISQDDHLQTGFSELRKARAYLRYCGFNPRLADRNWALPSITNAAVTGPKPRPVQSKPKPTLSHVAAQTPSSPSAGPSSRRLALTTPSQKASHPPTNRAELVQQQSRISPPQHRPNPVFALIAQHSPAAPLSKVPSQIFQVNPRSQAVPSSQSVAGRSINQGTRDVLQPSLPVQGQPHIPAGSDGRVANNAVPLLRGQHHASTSMKGRTVNNAVPLPQGQQHYASTGADRRVANNAVPLPQGEHHTSTGTARRVVNNAVPLPQGQQPYVSAASNGRVLNNAAPKSGSAPNSQKEHRLPAAPQTPPPKIPAAPRTNRNRRSGVLSESSGASAPQPNGHVVEDGELVSRKKRKQSAT